MAKKGVTYQMKGVDKVLKNMNAEFAKIGGATIPALIEAAVLIQNSMDKESPKVPVDTRNLQSSFFVTTNMGQKITGDDKGLGARVQGKTPAVAIGFSANYAAIVHEDTETKKNWNREGSGPKFMEAALERNKNTIIGIIKKHVQL